MKLSPTHRYVQIAFNLDLHQVRRILPQIPRDHRIIIEAGTPYIKREGINGIRVIRNLWSGFIVADLKVTDGALDEVQFAASAGANAVTVLGSAPEDTLNIFCASCASHRLYSMIDMLGVINPLKKLLPLKFKPDFVIIHKGRDEESNAQRIIRYKDITKIKSKYDSKISVAGGLTPHTVRSAYFNGADCAIINIVAQNDLNEGFSASANISTTIAHILSEIGE